MLTDPQTRYRAWMFRLHIFVIAFVCGAFLMRLPRIEVDTILNGLLTLGQARSLMWALTLGFVYLFAVVVLLENDRPFSAWVKPLQGAVRHPLGLVGALLIIAAGLTLNLIQPFYAWVWVYLIFSGLWLILLGYKGEKALAPIAIGSVILAQLTRLFYLYTAYPINDEGIYLTVGKAMQTGEGLVPAAAYIRPTIPIHPYWGYGNTLYGFWTQLFGADLITLRWFSYLLGLAALVPLYDGTRRLFGKKTALVSLTIASWSWMLFYSTRARNYGVPILVAALLIYAHIRLQQSQSPHWHHLFIGLGTLLLLEGHSLMLTVAFALAGWYALQYLQRAIEQRKAFFPDPLWYFAGGALIAAAAYIGLHILLPGLEEFQRITSGVQGNTDNALSGLLFPSPTLWERRLSYASSLNFDPGATIEWFLIGLALAVAALRYRKKAWYWLVLVTLVLLGYTLFDGRGYPIYTVFMLPVVFIGSGLLFTQPKEAPKAKSAIGLTGSLAFALLLAILAVFQITFVSQQADIGTSQRQAIESQLPALDAAYPDRSDEVIFGQGAMIAFMPQETFYSTSDAAARLGPFMNDLPYEAYWADALIKEWPIAYVTQWEPPSVMASYYAARNGQPVDPTATAVITIIPPGQALIRYAQQAELTSPAPAQLVAHTPLPATVIPGDTLTLESVWLTLNNPTQPLTAQATLTSPHTSPILLEPLTLRPPEAPPLPLHHFFRTSNTLTLPADLPPGDYTLTLTLNGDPTGEPHPLGTVTVDP